MIPFKSENDVFYRPRACLNIGLQILTRIFSIFGCHEGWVNLICKLEIKNCLHFQGFSATSLAISGHKMAESGFLIHNMKQFDTSPSKTLDDTMNLKV